MTPCIFCDLIDSGDAVWVARESEAVAFRPLPESQLAPGHTLVVPRLHCVGVQDAPSDALTSTLLLLQRVARAMESALGATGVVVLNASGPDSGQSVGHLHFHLVPCWADDQVTFWPDVRSLHTAPDDPHGRLMRALAP